MNSLFNIVAFNLALFGKNKFRQKEIMVFDSIEVLIYLNRIKAPHQVEIKAIQAYGVSLYYVKEK